MNLTNLPKNNIGVSGDACLYSNIQKYKADAQGEMRSMDSLRDSLPKSVPGDQPPPSAEHAATDAGEDITPGSNWSNILIFVAVPLVLLVAVVFGGFALISTAFGAEPAELLASQSTAYRYRF